ncbi:MAG: hypothetical protein B7Y41_04745 [Hydrogenophilales bacterium 28-61-23]|nr:MAG: hypothetical protein B7Y41_04745 [Hydrogenophilales bacterium 28-61-23]
MTTQNVAIVTAPNMRYVNTGMTTVELAAKSFIGRALPGANLSFYSIVPPNPQTQKKWMMMDLGYPHPSSSGVEKIFDHLPIFSNQEQLFSSDLILYWGDFLQARHYIDQECVGRVSEIHGIDKDKSADFCYRSLLQWKMPAEIKQKSIVFGSSLLYNTTRDYLSGDYKNAISDLLRHSQAALMRDPISATRINQLTGNYQASHLGIDPAFFLRKEDISQLPATSWSSELKQSDTIGLFFGARTSPPKGLLNFCRGLAEDLSAKLEWLPWFPVHEILRTKARPKLKNIFSSSNELQLQQIEGLMPRGDQYTQADLLVAASKYKLIITDTYHLCINSWNAGTPAICFGADGNSGSHVIKDFKKRVLYEMFDANSFYFDVSSLRDSNEQKLTKRLILSLLSDSSSTKFVLDNIRRHSSSVEGILANHAHHASNRG